MANRDTKHMKATPLPGPATEAARRSYMRLPAEVGEVDGAPVNAFGRLFIYGVSPDLAAGVTLQEGNERPWTKIQPKKSWEMDENHIGSMVSWQPRIPQNDFQPFLSFHLIDGNPETFWCSRGQGRPDVQPEWVRIDLAREEMLSEIVLLPRIDGQGIPNNLEIRLSCDGWHWTTVFEGRPTVPENGETIRFPLIEPTPVKQIWVIGTDLTATQIGPDFLAKEYHFLLAEFQVITEKGDNAALISRGAGVTVSSTNYGHGDSWDVYDFMWPTQYDLGAKWIRLSGSNPPYYHDTLAWRFVEREKGIYSSDEKTELAMEEAMRNGCKIIVILGYGNWLYTDQPENDSFEIDKFPQPFSHGPVMPEMREGYKNWVRYMVRQYKGKVAYWEIMNEPELFMYSPFFTTGKTILDYGEQAKDYCNLVKEVVPIIREEDPDVKISLGGACQTPGLGDRNWVLLCMEEGVFELVDAIGWHIQGSIVPEYPEFRKYPRLVREFKEKAEAHGFRGEYMASEFWLGSPYPSHEFWAHPPHKKLPGLPRLTDIRKAKDTARVFLMNAALDVTAFWCNTWFNGAGQDGGLFRTTFTADPVSPTQPEPAYYILRTLGTLLDGAEPADMDISTAVEMDNLHVHGFSMPDGSLMVGLYLTDTSVDDHPGIMTDVIIKGVRCGGVVGIDTLNGSEQELNYRQEDDCVVIPDLRIRDYPVMLKLKRAG